MFGSGGIPGARQVSARSGHVGLRRARTGLLAACATAALGAAVPAAASAAVTVSPLAGTPDAMPQTQISILGTPASNIASVTVTGSISGAHGGHLSSYDSAEGASYLLSSPLTEGEEVKVVVDLDSGSPVEDSFSVAHLAATEELLHLSGEEPEEQEHFKSAPELHPPKVKINKADPSLEGDIFTDPLPAPIIHPAGKLLEFKVVGPNGLMVLNPEGKLLWWHQFHEEAGSALQVITYEGKPALTWWQGKVTTQAWGLGEGIIANSNYEEIAHIKAGNGLSADIHEMYITPGGQAYINAVEPVCLPECTEEKPPVLDDEIQEIDIKTGLVMWSWHAYGHVNDAESEVAPAEGVWDPYHVNSIQALSEHRVLVSMRDTSGVYEIDQDGGSILWQIAGKKSSFTLGKDAKFYFQHDARLEGKHLNKLTLFDDEAGPPVHGLSRGLILRLNYKGMKAGLVHQYKRRETVAPAEGGMQVLPNGDAIVGFGATPYFSEYSEGGLKHKEGELLFDAELPEGDGTYRVERYKWEGTPNTLPALAAERTSLSEVSVYASWNGATSVAKWEVLAGESPEDLAPAETAAWSNFETEIPLTSTDSYFEVKALNSENKVLATSEVVKASE